MATERKYAAQYPSDTPKQNQSEFFARYYHLLNRSNTREEVYNMVEEEHLKRYGFYRFKNFHTFRTYLGRYFSSNPRF